MPKRIVLYGQRDRSKKDSSRGLSIRGVLALIIVLGLTALILRLTSGFYYTPICQRYAETERVIYDGYSMGWPKRHSPAECFFRDRRGNSRRVEVSTLEMTSEDWTRWLLSWGATIAGVGGSVWLATLVSGSRRKGRRRKDG